jgi:phospholipase/carboxylesterase
MRLNVDTPKLSLHHVTRAPLASGTGPHPALVLLHGRGADELDLLPLADELDPGFFVVSARAPLRLGPGYAWYHLQAIGSPDATSYASSLATLVAFTRSLPAAYPIDPERIVVLGFSQGAMMAGSLLVSEPELSAATVMLSGYLPVGAGLAPASPGLAGRPAFGAHGTADQVLPIALGRQARDCLQQAGVDLTWHEYPIGHSIAAPELLDLAAWLQGKISHEPA